jgi:hypothetical protein
MTKFKSGTWINIPPESSTQTFHAFGMVLNDTHCLQVTPPNDENPLEYQIAVTTIPDKAVEHTDLTINMPPAVTLILDAVEKTCEYLSK